MFITNLHWKQDCSIRLVMGKENQCHRELVEDKGSRKQGTIIFSQNCFLGMQIGKQNVPEKLQQQFLILENNVSQQMLRLGPKGETLTETMFPQKMVRQQCLLVCGGLKISPVIMCPNYLFCWTCGFDGILRKCECTRLSHVFNTDHHKTTYPTDFKSFKPTIQQQ